VTGHFTAVESVNEWLGIQVTDGRKAELRHGAAKVAASLFSFPIQTQMRLNQNCLWNDTGLQGSNKRKLPHFSSNYSNKINHFLIIGFFATAIHFRRYLSDNIVLEPPREVGVAPVI
jgi:hypothetical protein